MSLAGTVERPNAILTGERNMGNGEPTAEQAAALVREMQGAGTVARLDLVHGALLAAYRAGRAAEQEDVRQLAQEHAAAFAAAVSRRSEDQAARDALPWALQ